jgi:hypothetical protein
LSDDLGEGESVEDTPEKVLRDAGTLVGDR